jgi:hypothetical protein
MELKPKRNIILIFLKVLSMGNYFILSSKVGDKWAKVASNMTSVNFGEMHTYCWDLVHFRSSFPSFRPFIPPIIQP